MDQIKDMTVMWDDQSATPFAYTISGSVGLVSYDDERSICLKTEYALKENLQGFVSSYRADLSTINCCIINLTAASFSALDHLGAVRRRYGRPEHTVARHGQQ